MPKGNPLDLAGTTVGRVEFLHKLSGRLNGCVPYRARCLNCNHEWDCRGAITARRVARRPDVRSDWDRLRH